MGRTLGAKKASRVRVTEIAHTMPAVHRIAVPAGVRELAGCSLEGTYPFTSSWLMTAGAITVGPLVVEGFLRDLLDIENWVGQSNGL